MSRVKLSPNAEKAMLLLYIGQVGWNDPEKSADPEGALIKLADITPNEAHAAFLECEAHGFMTLNGLRKGST